MNEHQLNQLKQNIEQMAERENKSVLDIINELLAGAAAHGHEAAVEALLEIRAPIIQPELDKIHSR